MKVGEEIVVFRWPLLPEFGFIEERLRKVGETTQGKRVIERFERIHEEKNERKPESLE